MSVGSGRKFGFLHVLFVLALLVLTASAAQAEKHIALVIGNADYQAGAFNTPANDAGLIAQTLQAAGFDVVGARDLDQDSLRRPFAISSARLRLPVRITGAFTGSQRACSAAVLQRVPLNELEAPRDA